MADVVVTVPKSLWDAWIDEGELPGEPWGGMESHFWLFGSRPEMAVGDRVYIVAHGRLRGCAPLERIEERCRLRPEAHCLLRRNGAVAVTITEPFRGFRGWRYVWWDRQAERPFPDWRIP